MELGPLTPTEDNDELRRRVLWSIPTVLAVLGTSRDDGSAHLMNISWVVPVSNEPTQLLASVESASQSSLNLSMRPYWTLSVLSRSSRELGRAFVKPVLSTELRGGLEYVQGHQIGRSNHGTPFLADSVSVLGGTAERIHSLGEHDLWLLLVEQIAACPEVLEGPASRHAVEILGVHDTRMNYGR